MVLWSLIRNINLVFVPISGTDLLKPLRFPKWTECQGVFCYVTEVTFFTRIWGWRLFSRRTNHVLRRWEFSDLSSSSSQLFLLPSLSREEKKAGDWVQIPISSDLINNEASIKKQKDEFRELLGWWSHGDVGRVVWLERAWKLAALPLCVLPSSCFWVLSFHNKPGI